MNRFHRLPKHISHKELSKLSRICSTSAQFGPTRHVTFNPISDAHVSYFRSVLGDSSVITNVTDLQPLNVDWMRRFIGSSTVALRPTSVEQVSKIMSYCNTHHLPIVPQGGNTGLVGGSVPVFDEIILSMSVMNEIETFEPDSGVVVTQAGVTLESLDKYLASVGYRVPLDLGAKKTCQIGGNVATNAAGTRYIRYGSLRASVLGLEAVLPDGRVLDTLTTLRKDNTGYDVKQLMIGSEGTLGVITRLAIACPMRGAALNTVILRVDRFENIKSLLQLARHKLGEILSAFEYLDDESVELATTHLTDVSNPLPCEKLNVAAGGGLVLIECAGSNVNHDHDKLDEFLEMARECSIVTNGFIAGNEAESGKLWKLRENLATAVLKAGPEGSLKYDLSLPLSAFHLCVREARTRVSHLDNVRVAGWGHVGDGNLHLNIVVPDASLKEQVANRMEPWVYEFVATHNGSVSAEHGLGVMKAGAIGYSKSAVAIDIMRALKTQIDPNGICNPYKVLPPAQ